MPAHAIRGLLSTFFPTRLPLTDSLQLRLGVCLVKWMENNDGFRFDTQQAMLKEMSAPEKSQASWDHWM